MRSPIMIRPSGGKRCARSGSFAFERRWSLLRDGMKDADSGVRAVAVTYLGILHEEPRTSIPLLVTALEDEDFAVRRAAATALGSFGVAADQAIPALRKATNDADEDVAREAGLSIVKIQTATKK
jgi:HEAT repeat protein